MKPASKNGLPGEDGGLRLPTVGETRLTMEGAAQLDRERRAKMAAKRARGPTTSDLVVGWVLLIGIFAGIVAGIIHLLPGISVQEVAAGIGDIAKAIGGVVFNILVYAIAAVLWIVDQVGGLIDYLKSLG